MRDASKLIAVSRAEEGQYRQMIIKEDKTVIVPNGLDIERFKNLPRYGQFREKHGIRAKHMILFLGRIHKRKGIGFLIKSFKYLSKEMNDSILVIVGPDDSYRTDLEKLVKTLNLSNSIKFIGYVDNILEAYVDADVLVYPTIHEIFGLVPFEAIMCGTPVIVTDDCGCGELIKAANSGYLVKYGDIKGLKEMLKHVLKNPEEGTEKVERGKKYIADNLRLENVVRKMEWVYKDCVFHV